MRFKLNILPVVILGCGVATSAPAMGEFVVSAFTGLTSTENTDLTLKQPGTDLTLHDAKFHGEDFGSPPYYGGRITYFLDKHQSGWGFGLEFFHPKIYLDTGETVRVTGTSGTFPTGNQPAGAYFDHFNNSHGLNFLTFEGMYRYYIADPEKTFWGRFQPYAGGGIALLIPHVESELSNGGPDYGEYQINGPGFQGMIGLNFELAYHFSIFTEYKLTYALLDESIPGGSVQLDPLTHALIMGVSFHF